jgi:hypothetical protein
VTGVRRLHEAVREGDVAAIAALLGSGAVDGAEGRWRQVSDATLDDWQRCADLLRARGAVE